MGTLIQQLEKLSAASLRRGRHGPHGTGPSPGWPLLLGHGTLPPSCYCPGLWPQVRQTVQDTECLAPHHSHTEGSPDLSCHLTQHARSCLFYCFSIREICLVSFTIDNSRPCKMDEMSTQHSNIKHFVELNTIYCKMHSKIGQKMQ